MPDVDDVNALGLDAGKTIRQGYWTTNHFKLS